VETMARRQPMTLVERLQTAEEAVKKSEQERSALMDRISKLEEQVDQLYKALTDLTSRMSQYQLRPARREVLEKQYQKDRPDYKPQPRHGRKGEPVVVIGDGKIWLFPSGGAAARALGINQSTVWACCRNNEHVAMPYRAYGYICFKANGEGWVHYQQNNIVDLKSIIVILWYMTIFI